MCKVIEVAPGLAVHPKPVRMDSIAPFRFAIWSDGQLSLMDATTEINLPEPAVRQLYLSLNHFFTQET